MIASEALKGAGCMKVTVVFLESEVSCLSWSGIGA